MGRRHMHIRHRKTSAKDEKADLEVIALVDDGAQWDKQHNAPPKASAFSPLHHRAVCLNNPALKDRAHGRNVDG